MRVIYNKFIPFKGFYAISILCWIFAREECRKWHNTPTYYYMLNHEGIHFEQQKELGFIFFYILYLLEWLIKLCFYGKHAYENISFEREAFANERNTKYREGRRRYAWLKRILK